MPEKMRLNQETVLPASLEKCLTAQRWIGRQSDAWRFKCHVLAKEKYFRLKQLYDDCPEGILSDTALMISAYECKTASMHGKTEQIEAKEVDSLRFKSARKTRMKPQFEWLDDHQAVVKGLLQEKCSYRAIATYLLHRHKHEVSHTTISDYVNMKGWKDVIA